jgi:hypothetical protein
MPPPDPRRVEDPLFAIRDSSPYRMYPVFIIIAFPIDHVLMKSDVNNSTLASYITERARKCYVIIFYNPGNHRRDQGRRTAVSSMRSTFRKPSLNYRSARGRMGAIAKKIIGVAATATAATMVRIFTDMARLGSACRNDNANAPVRSRTPIAETSAMINPIIFLRRRCSNPDFSFGAEMVSDTKLFVITGRCRDGIVAKRVRRQKFVAGCRVAQFGPPQRSVEKAQNGAAPLHGGQSKARRFAIM